MVKNTEFLKGEIKVRIMVEGADGTGKTTIINNLAEIYNCNVLHLTKWGPRNINRYKEQLNLHDVIFDRSFISELVYKQAFFKKPLLSFKEVLKLLKYAKKKGWKIIILTNDEKTLKDRLISRGNEDPEIINRIVEINNLYKTYASSFDITMIDTSDKNYFEKIIEIVKEE